MPNDWKQLLFRDLCGRLPYGVMIYLYTSSDRGSTIVLNSSIYSFIEDVLNNSPYEIKEIKPYLRPMSSMTDEEKKIVCSMNMISDMELNDRINYQRIYVRNYTIETFDYFNERKLDYRGLIPIGLALEAPEGMYKF